MGVKTELCRVERSTTLLTGIDQFLRGQLICGLHHASFYAVLRAEFSARVAQQTRSALVARTALTFRVLSSYSRPVAMPFGLSKVELCKLLSARTVVYTCDRQRNQPCFSDS